MGLVINNLVPQLNFPQLLDQLEIDVDCDAPETAIHAGGPVETGRGFVLHSADYMQESTLIVSETVAVTATVDILKAIAEGGGPSNHLLVLGYSGWGPGQIEVELKSNAWLCADADDEILFRTSTEDKWPRAMAMIGVDITMLSSESGRA